MKNISLTIGHNVNGAAKWTIQNITAAVSLTLDIEAFTAIPCYGMWRGEAEESTRIEICSLTDEQAQEIRARIPKLSELLEQEAIMYQETTANVEFVEPANIPAMA